VTSAASSPFHDRGRSVPLIATLLAVRDDAGVANSNGGGRVADVGVLGPVELAVIAFPGSNFNGSVAPALAELVEQGTIRIIDLVFVRKDEDGSMIGLELDDLGDEAGPFDDLDGEAGGLLSDEDLEMAAELLEPGSSAVLIVWENTWARKVVSAIAGSGGVLVAHDRIDAETVAMALESLEA
jgi:hypothetical protein